eukprot:7020070-Karenia_brevis.AAC.1
MGLTESSFFGRAVRVAPARKGARARGASPRTRRQIKDVVCSSSSSLSSVFNASCKCPGRSPDGPDAESRWKERMARSTASASGVGARFALGRPSVVKFGGLWLAGCFACNWSRTADVCPR